MATTFSDFVTELQSLISTVWPEIQMPGTTDPSGGNIPPQFYLSIEAYRENVIDRAERGEQGEAHIPAPPYVVLHIGQMDEDEEFGLDNQIMRCPVSFIYLDSSQNGADQFSVTDKVLALKAAIDGPGATFTTFNPIENGHINSSETDPTNAELVDKRNQNLIAASLSYTPGFQFGTYNN